MTLYNFKLKLKHGLADWFRADLIFWRDAKTTENFKSNRDETIPEYTKEIWEMVKGNRFDAYQMGRINLGALPENELKKRAGTMFVKHFWRIQRSEVSINVWVWIMDVWNDSYWTL